MVAQLVTTVMNLMYSDDAFALPNLSFEFLLDQLVEANLLNAQQAASSLRLAPDLFVNQLSGPVVDQFVQAVATAWAAKFVLTLSQILARNVDYIDALDRFDAGNLSIFPVEQDDQQDDQQDDGEVAPVGDFDGVGELRIRQPEGGEPGDPIEFSYRVRNVGDSALTASVFSIPIRTPSGEIADVECINGRNVTLQPNDVFDCEATRTGLTEVGRYEAWPDWRSTNGVWHQGDLGGLKTFQIAEEGESTPSRPLGLVVNTTSHDSVVLAWEGPVRGGNPRFDEYIVREQASGTIQCSLNASERACDANTDLEPATEYTFEVVAKNDVGESPTAAITVRTDPAPEHKVVVRARGERGEEEFELHIDGQEYGAASVTREWADYSFTIPQSVNGPLAVVFSNDFYNGSDVDRNLEIDNVKVNGTVHETESDSTYSEGAWSSEEGCSPGFRQNELVSCGGRFIFGELQPDGTLSGAQDPYLPEEIAPDEEPANHVIRVRARGVTGGERFALRVGAEIIDHVVVGKKWRTYRFPMNELPSGSVVVGFMNDFDDDVNDFNLQVDFIRIDDRRFETESSGTWSSTAGDGPECVSGHRSSEYMYCNGAFFFTDI